MFSSVQQGLLAGNVGSFSRYMASQVYMSLRGAESGYYSSNQAYYLLESYLKARRFSSVNFTTVGESESNPYATGSAAFTFRGGRDHAQVYVSLSSMRGRWVITHINIY